MKLSFALIFRELESWIPTTQPRLCSHEENAGLSIVRPGRVGTVVESRKQRKCTRLGWVETAENVAAKVLEGRLHMTERLMSDKDITELKRLRDYCTLKQPL